MTYALIDLEVTEPLKALEMPQDKGLALVLRCRDRPVGFAMIPPAVGRITTDDLAKLISHEAGALIWQEQIRAELSPEPEVLPLGALTVAICTKDRPEDLASCLGHLQALQAGTDFEILVVDNAPSDDRTRALVAGLKGVRYTCEPRAGLDFGRNRAIQEATGEWLAFIDDDVRVDRGWLAGLSAVAAEHPDAEAFTGLILPAELATEAQALFEQRGGFRRGFVQVRHNRSRPGDRIYPCGAGIFGAGCNMVFRRAMLIELGGFDDALDTGRPLPGGGDLDIFYRVVRSGRPLVYEPRMLVFHRHRREYEKLRRQYWTWGLGFMAFIDKSYRSDPEWRPQLRRMIRWWFRDQGEQLWSSLSGRHVLSPDMVLAELWGGVVGLCGEYSRSRRRVAEIRRQHL